MRSRTWTTVGLLRRGAVSLVCLVILPACSHSVTHERYEFTVAKPPGQPVYDPSSKDRLCVNPSMAAPSINSDQYVVVTNQPDVARGTQQREAVEEMERQLRAMLPLDDVLTCYHDDPDGCDCRKPRPGLMMRAAQQYGIDLSRSYLVGDRWRDIEAGVNAGCKTVWIDYGYSEQGPASSPDVRVGSLPEAVDWILTRAKEPA